MSALDSIGAGGVTSRPKIPLEQVTRAPDATPPPRARGKARNATSDTFPSSLTASHALHRLRQAWTSPADVFQRLLSWAVGGPLRTDWHFAGPLDG